MGPTPAARGHSEATITQCMPKEDTLEHACLARTHSAMTRKLVLPAAAPVRMQRPNAAIVAIIGIWTMIGRGR